MTQDNGIVPAPFRLRVYVSSAMSLFEDQDLTELLDTARRRNAEVGITGLLLYADGCFLQAFEGPKNAVEDLRARIFTDHRHKGILNLIQIESNERCFSDWTMGFVKTARRELASVDGLSNYLETGHLEREINQRQVMILLDKFRQSNLRVA